MIDFAESKPAVLFVGLAAVVAGVLLPDVKLVRDGVRGQALGGAQQRRGDGL